MTLIYFFIQIKIWFAYKVKKIIAFTFTLILCIICDDTAINTPSLILHIQTVGSTEFAVMVLISISYEIYSTYTNRKYIIKTYIFYIN